MGSKLIVVASNNTVIIFLPVGVDIANPGFGRIEAEHRAFPRMPRNGLEEACGAIIRLSRIIQIVLGARMHCFPTRLSPDDIIGNLLHHQVGGRIIEREIGAPVKCQ